MEEKRTEHPILSYHLSPRSCIFQKQGTFTSLYTVRLMYCLKLFKIWQNAKLLFTHIAASWVL